MASKKLRILAVGLALCAGLVGIVGSSARADGPPPSLNAPDLAQGQYSLMHMRFQKTILKINVADIDVRIDKPTQARVADLARNHGYSESLEQQIAPVAIGAARAVVQMQFVRDVPLKRWMGVVRDNLEQAREAGLITKEIEKKVSDGLPGWFGALDKRGYEKGDRLIYSVTPDAVRTVVVSAGGQTLIDMTERDPEARKVVMASYFAPKSDFREPLLRSLVEGTH
jgi:hypothetical protein